VWCDTTSEPLAAMLRPGNAGANDAEDHLELLDQALAALPAGYQAGHEPGDDPGAVVHPILVRADSAGATHGFINGLVEANCEFSIGHRIDKRVREGLLLAQEEDWVPAVEADKRRRQGAWVIELSALVDLSSWPKGTRLVCRRERPHPDAQLSLFDTGEGFRHTCFITNSTSADICALECRHRGHARVEDRVRNWKDCGLSNLPFEDVVRNMAWVQVSLRAGALLAWAQMTALSRTLAKAEPKALRHRILHVAALLVRRGRRLVLRGRRLVLRGRRLVLRLDKRWPWSRELAEAFVRVRAAFP
jgi:hypothetical protein